MSVQRGQRVGVSGMLTLASGQQLGGDAYYWKQSTEIAVKDRTGRGGTRFATFRRLNVGAHLAFRMNGTGTATPFPVGQQNCKGTLTLTYHVDTNSSINKYVTLVGVLVNSEMQYGSPKGVKDMPPSEAWDCGGVLRLTAEPSFSGWTGQLTPSAETFSDQELDVEGSISTDAYGLNNRGIRAWDALISGDTASAEAAKAAHFLTSASPVTAAKAISVTMQRTDRAGATFKTLYGPLDPQDQIIVPRTNSVRSYTEPFTDRQAWLVNATASIASISNTIANSSQGTYYLRSIMAQLKTPGIAYVVADYYNPGQLWKGATRSGERQVKARIAGGNAQLYVDRVIAYTTARALIYLGIVDDYSVVIRDFVLFRMFTCTTIPEYGTVTVNGASKTFPQLGQVNSATWQGLAAGTVVYQGAQFKVKIDQLTNGALTMFMGYRFHVNSNGIINGVPTSYIRRAYLRQFSGSLPTDQSWVDASTLGFPNVAAPSSASFADFTS